MTDNQSIPELFFPCNYLLKIIGLANDEFESIVIPILHKHIENLSENAITYTKSSSDKYISMTVDFYADSREQVDQLYRELTAKPQVLMAL